MPLKKMCSERERFSRSLCPLRGEGFECKIVTEKLSHDVSITEARVGGGDGGGAGGTRGTWAPRN